MQSLTEHDLHQLSTLHGNTAESQSIRTRLESVGLHWCNHCESAKAASRMCGRTICHECSSLSRRRPAYDRVTTPERTSQAWRRSRKKNRRKHIERMRTYNAARDWRDGKDIASQYDANRVRYQERLALGMSPSQAAYKADWSEFAGAWQAYCNEVRPRRKYASPGDNDAPSPRSPVRRPEPAQ